MGGKLLDCALASDAEASDPTKTNMNLRRTVATYLGEERLAQTWHQNFVTSLI